MHKFERVIRIIVVLIILVFVSLLVARVTQAQMSPYDDELSQQLRGVRRPAFSPDGRFVTYVRTTIDRATHAETTELVTVSVSDRKDITVARAAINVAPPAPTGSVFSSDSAVKFELADDRDGAQLRSVSARDGVTSTLFRCACSLSQLAVDRAGTVAAFVRSSNTEPPDVWMIALTHGATAKPLTRVNARVVLEALMTEAETFSLPAVGEVPPPIRVLPPASLEPGRRYPMIVRVVDTAHKGIAALFELQRKALGW